jgi:Skp family chaperone for outer membrane proteins
VKKSHRWAILAITVSLGYLISLAVAQNQAGPSGQPAGGARLALIDVTKIFKNHIRFKQDVEDMNRDYQAVQAKLKAERDAINKIATEVLPTYNKGTPQYSETEEQLTSRTARLQVDVARQKNEFLQREASIYHKVYQEVLRETDYFCRQRGVDMVLSFDGAQVDVQRPDSVLRFINRPVVWYDQGLDITNLILQGVNGPGANPATADQRAQPPAPSFENRK